MYVVKKEKEVALKLYGVNATIIIFVLVLYCIVKRDLVDELQEGGGVVFVGVQKVPDETVEYLAREEQRRGQCYVRLAARWWKYEGNDNKISS